MKTRERVEGSEDDERKKESVDDARPRLTVDGPDSA